MHRSQAEAIREIQGLLADPTLEERRARRAQRRASTESLPGNRPEHYSVICISLYKEDLARLDAMVADLKAQGHRKMNRSALIRYALDQVDPASLPKSY